MIIKKIIFACLCCISTSATSATFVHPLDFDKSISQKNKVIAYIKLVVNNEYCKTINLCTPSTIRLMEQHNLIAFKKLTTVKNRKLLDRMIHDYCRSTLKMCNYSTLRRMYAHNLSASKQQQLTW